jgi:threonine dehydrogenase-like Zn-dependent dehydrogenase
MRATLMYGAGDVRVENVPDSVIKQPTDALVRVTSSCICGSDLHPYHSMSRGSGPARMGHEFIGIVEDTGSDVSTVEKGDLVVAPFAISCGTCVFCREGLYTSCLHGGFWDNEPFEGGQAEAARVPFADGTLVKLNVSEDSALMPSLLTLSDVFGTGYHAALTGGVNERTSVTVIGDGAVGLLAVLSARRLGAEQIILMGRHQVRTDLGREFGATDVVAERGEEGAVSRASPARVSPRASARGSTGVQRGREWDQHNGCTPAAGCNQPAHQTPTTPRKGDSEADVSLRG